MSIQTNLKQQNNKKPASIQSEGANFKPKGCDHVIRSDDLRYLQLSNGSLIGDQ